MRGMTEPPFRRPAPDTSLAHQTAGVLTPETIRAALDALWNPPPREPSPYDRALVTAALERIPVMRPEAYALLRMRGDEADRARWLQGIKERLGLVCRDDPVGGRR
jgi:hypothetical protein